VVEKFPYHRIGGGN